MNGVVELIVAAPRFWRKNDFCQVWEIEKALDAKIFCFNVESESELRLIRSVGLRRGLTGIPISLRVNPDVDAQVEVHLAPGH